jgi:hypothetical protein
MPMDPYNAARECAEVWLTDVHHMLERGDACGALDKLRIIEGKIIEMGLRGPETAIKYSAEASYVVFEQVMPDPKRKTLIWEVWSKGDGSSGSRDLLGHVKWYGAWRCYGFFPAGNCIFEKICLKDIARFCESKTIQHRWKKQGVKL